LWVGRGKGGDTGGKGKKMKVAPISEQQKRTEGEEESEGKAGSRARRKRKGTEERNIQQDSDIDDCDQRRPVLSQNGRRK
jgi:hypothetical protein